MESKPITTIYATVIVAVSIGLLALSNANAKHLTGFNVLDDPTAYGNNGATTQPLDLRPRCPAANPDDMAGWHDYDFEARAGASLLLEYTVFDIDSWDTAKWLINGDCLFEDVLEDIADTADGGTESRTVVIPGSTLVTGTNTLSFVQEPVGNELKVFDVKINALPATRVNDPTAYGNNGATTQPLDERPRCPAANLDDMAGWHDYDFEARAGEDLTLEYTIFDIDGWDTVKWLINSDCLFDDALEDIATTADGGTESRTVAIPGSTLVTGTNTLSFVQEPVGNELKVSNVKVVNNALDDTYLLDLFHSALEDCTTALANSGSTCTLCSDLEVDILDAACDVLQVKPATSIPAFIDVITALSNAVLNNTEICDPETAASCLTLILGNLP
jgi:hypothetical protein